jgi:hypothetical protein
MDWV